MISGWIIQPSFIMAWGPHLCFFIMESEQRMEMCPFNWIKFQRCTSFGPQPSLWSSVDEIKWNPCRQQSYQMLSMLKTTSSYLWAKAPCSFTCSVLHSFIHFQRTRSPMSMRLNLIVNINFRFELAQARWWISVPKIPSTIHLPCGIVQSPVQTRRA